MLSVFISSDGLLLFRDLFLTTTRFTIFFFLITFVFFVFFFADFNSSLPGSLSSVSKSFNNLENSSTSSRQSTFRTSASSSRVVTSRFSASFDGSVLTGHFSSSASESVTSTSVSVSTSTSSSSSSSSLPDSNRLNLSLR